MNTLNRITTFLVLSAIILIPTLASACGMGAMGMAGLGEALMIAFVIFLAGYLPYVVASVKLSIEAGRPEGTKSGTRIVANIFAGINTTVFVLGLLTLLSTAPNPLIILGDFMLWGIPFFFYYKGIKGAKAKPGGTSDLLDA
ncbi:MAG: hypothetical protein GY810_21050 [Aureispira sp.]|nr:hypothetical protein [Aureispira sp.]